MRSKSNGGVWRVPVVSECPRSTALYLLTAEGKKREKAVDYLIRRRIWEESVTATAALVKTLLAMGERGDAIDIARKTLVFHPWAAGGAAWDDDSVLDEITRRSFGGDHRSFRSAALKRALRLLLKTTPGDYWTGKNSQMYEFLPQVSALFIHNDDFRKLISRLLLPALNRDGSYGGIATPTAMAAYLLRLAGEEDGPASAIRWLDSLANDNGSIRPILNQDVYDTAWGVLCGADASTMDRSLRWLESTKVEETGYPYYSEGYYPDCDDTALVLLSKAFAGMVIDGEGGVKFLLDSQNPDGGWGFLSFPGLKHALPYRFAVQRFKTIGRRIQGRRSAAFWNPSFDSTVDMTARVLVCLSKLKRPPIEVKRTVSKGVSYILSRYRNGSFHQSNCWTDSLPYETSLALIALKINNAQPYNSSEILSSLDQTQVMGGDDIAHVLWAHAILETSPRDKAKLVGKLIESQNEDGFWLPNVSFRISSWYHDPVFSTALPMLSLKAYLASAEVRGS